MLRTLYILLAAMMAFVASGAQAEDLTLRSARALCAWFDATKLLSEKCSISAWNSTLDISIDMTADDARKLCEQLPTLLAKNKPDLPLALDDAWQLRIFSPYSGERTIATCDLNAIIAVGSALQNPAFANALNGSPAKADSQGQPARLELFQWKNEKGYAIASFTIENQSDQDLASSALRCDFSEPQTGNDFGLDSVRSDKPRRRSAKGRI
jgi:hypothetical protein